MLVSISGILLSEFLDLVNTVDGIRLIRIEIRKNLFNFLLEIISNVIDFFRF